MPTPVGAWKPRLTSKGPALPPLGAAARSIARPNSLIMAVIGPSVTSPEADTCTANLSVSTSLVVNEVIFRKFSARVLVTGIVFFRSARPPKYRPLALDQPSRALNLTFSLSLGATLLRKLSPSSG